MSRALERRLERLEVGLSPKVLGHMQCIYARDMADYERQKAGLIASGRGKLADFFVDMNYRWPAYRDDVREPETEAWTQSHDDFVRGLTDEEKAQ
jgi:hypothetical protein